MSKETYVVENRENLEQRAHPNYVRASNRFNLFTGGVLALWLLGIGCGKMYDRKEKNLRALMPELELIDSTYTAQINALDRSNPRYYALCDSLKTVHDSNINAVKKTYRENGLLE